MPYDVLSMIAAVAGAATLPGSIHLATLSAAALLPARKPVDATPFAGHLAIVIPAHDEADGLAATLDSVNAVALIDGRCRVIVIADNCNDNTAAIARAHGVVVLERHDALRRGKGYALDFAFRELAGSEAEWFIVVDADSRLDACFLPAMRRAMGRAGGRNCALQADYLSRPTRGVRGRLSRLAQGGFNRVRNLGRSRLAASSTLLGNGFALHRETLAQVPYLATSVVEDLEYQLRLLSHQVSVEFVADAHITGEIAQTVRGARIQRSRWEGGRLRMMATHLPRMMARIVRRQWGWLEPAADLALLPLGLHLTAAALAFSLADGIGLVAAGAASIALILHLLAILRHVPLDRADGFALLGTPFYVGWKLALLPATLFAARRDAPWLRTERASCTGPASTS